VYARLTCPPSCLVTKPGLLWLFALQCCCVADKMFAFVVLGLVSSVLAKRLAGKIVSLLYLWIQWSWVVFSNLQRAWCPGHKVCYTNNIIVKNAQLICYVYWPLQVLLLLTVIRNIAQLRQLSLFLDNNIVDCWHIELVCILFLFSFCV